MDNYDDGLVHNHRWAREPERTSATVQSALIAYEAEDFDAGLEHGHSWARTDWVRH